VCVSGSTLTRGFYVQGARVTIDQGTAPASSISAATTNPGLLSSFGPGNQGHLFQFHSQTHNHLTDHVEHLRPGNWRSLPPATRSSSVFRLHLKHSAASAARRRSDQSHGFANAHSPCGRYVEQQWPAADANDAADVFSSRD
jgi:hypothetical protein